MTKADLEKKEATIITLQNENSKLQSQRRVMEQKSSSLEEVRECFGTVCGLLGVSPEGVFSTSVQQAVMEKVKILMASSKESAVEVLSLNEKLEELLGETAQEKERANHMTSELERCKCSLREAEKEGELAKTEKERLRQTLARTSAQFESNRKRMKDLEEKQSKSLPAIDHNSCEEVSKLRQHLSDMELQLQDLQDSYAGKDASIQALQQQLASSQDLLGEFLDELSAQLGLVEQDTTPNSCIQQIVALKNENTKLTKSLKMADEQRLVAEAGAKANRETILRLVSEAKEHESRLQRLAKLEQERDLAFASKVSAEHDREELSGELARVCERVKEMEELSLVQGRQVDAVRDELERCQLNLSTQEQQVPMVWGWVGARREGCDASSECVSGDWVYVSGEGVSVMSVCVSGEGVCQW
jgi:predicted  nucleic acid-binding Zn-ribbon protein